MTNTADDSPGNTPDISVIVIVYNDAARLPAAVQSVLGQSLRNVEVVIADDCSTDSSYEVAQRLAAEHPHRVRAMRLPENSGGCGEPRNQGIAVARGDYIMFLDSDDTLERDACRNMLAAARTSGADLISGKSVRVHVDNRNNKRADWYPWLYRTTRTFESIAEIPDLFVFDTLSTNKCYRRSFLTENKLTFPRGIHYEDLLFSAKAYLAAERITLIPQTVYYWNVVEKTEKKSISNRRHEITNFADRLTIHREIDELLKHYGRADLRLRKDIKFLKHDLILYLRDLPFLDEEYQHLFAEMANSYISTFPQEAFDELDPIHAICAYLLMQEDWPNLMPAIDTLLNRSKVSSPLVERDGRIYWCAEHLDDPRARALLDVTDQGYHSTPLKSLTLRNELTGYSESASGVVLDGSLVNPLGTIRPDAQLSAELEFKARRWSPRSFRLPVQILRHEGDFISWHADVPLRQALRPLGLIDEVWDMRMRLTADGEVVTGKISASSTNWEESGAVVVRPLLTRATADRLTPEVSAKGHLAFVLTQHGRTARVGRSLVERNLQGRPARAVKRTLRVARDARRRLDSGPGKIRSYHRMLKLLPVRKGTIVFESHLGKQYSDSPRAIYEELRARNAPVTAIWSYVGSTPPKDYPEGVELVERWSWRYLRALAQAEFWIDNQGIPLKLAKRPDTTYIQTWHGSALKRMGFDEPKYRVMSEGEQQEYQRALDRFDHFVVRGEHDVRTLARAYRLPESKLLRTGYPRNDALVRGRDATEPGAAARAVAEHLGIRAGLPVILYAPTFRASHDGRVRPFTLPFDVEDFAERFGDRYTLLVRSHYLNKVTLPPSVAGRVVDVTGVPDITPLLLLSDALITDYSSVMFDYALLERPMVFFAYDWEEYAHDIRGTYFDLLAEAPGPVARTADELYAAVADLDAVRTGYGDRVRDFVARYGEYDRGDAAARIVDQFFGTAAGVAR
jgi:CDP-glycerol glycerophosphotransferase